MLRRTLTLTPTPAPMLALMLALTAAACSAPEPPPVDPAWRADSVARWVDPFIGTHGDGNTFPGATVPWGMTAPSPHTRLASPLDFFQNGKLAAAGYVDDDPEVHGFGLTHLSGTGCPDLGAPVIAATSGKLATDFDAYGARRQNERAWPGYWGADLVEPNVRAELTATARTAALRFFMRGGDLNVLIDVTRPLSWSGGGHVRVVSPREVEGYVQTGIFCGKQNAQRVYFVGRFDHAAARAGTFDHDAVSDAAEADGSAGAWFTFGASAGRLVELQVGISYTSLDGARTNLDAELSGRAFDDVRIAATDAWEATLGRVRVEGGSDDARTTFYTALYHALLHPSIASDAGGAHLRFGGGNVVEVDAAHDRYHVFSLWDTYRTVHPLLTLLYPERQRDMVRSILQMTIEAGAPPMWELAGNEVQMMVGDPADVVLADSAVKGVMPEPELAAAAWPILQAAALDTTSAMPHRAANAAYRMLGYVPIEQANLAWGPVSTTLEYALADWALTRLGAALGVAVDPALELQADSWKNLVDPATQLFRPRHADGSFADPFDPDAIDGSHDQKRSGGPGFVEGTAWQYGFFAPHAVEAQAAATGGAEAYVARLQSLFDSGRFATWNEPDLGFPYLFTRFAGEGWRTAAQVRDARARAFTTAHDGIPGNDDCGTMSAWYVFSALGFYPDLPGGDDYAVGTPLFERATLTLPAGSFVLNSPHASPEHIYVRAASLAGRTIGQRLRHADVVAGGTLHLELSDTPR